MNSSLLRHWRKATIVAALFITVITATAYLTTAAHADTPDISVTAPTASPYQYWRGEQTIQWSLLSTSTDKISLAYSSNFSTFSNPIAENLASSTTSQDWNTKNVSDGVYEVRVLRSSADFGTSAKFTIDNTAPTTTLTNTVTPSANGWYNIVSGPPDITLTCNDPVVNGVSSGCSNTYYAWYNASTGAVVTSTTTTSGAVTAPQGDNILVYYSEDNAVDNQHHHNVEQAHKVEFKVDTQAPSAPNISLPTYINATASTTVPITGTGNEAGDIVNYTLSDSATPANKITGTTTVATLDSSTGLVKDLSLFADGQVTLTASLTDPAGNTGATTTVHSTKDTVAAIKSITSNANKAVILPIGGTIDFVMTPTTVEPNATVNGSYNGETLNWTSPDGGKTYAATYTVKEGQTNQSTSTPLQIKDVTYTDAAGNTSAKFNGSDVLVGIDATRPTLTSVSIASNNAHSAYAKVGDVVTLSFTASENIQTPTVTIAGHTATVLGSGENWTASTTMTSSDTEGSVPFSIGFTDLEWNSGTTVTGTTDHSSVTFDKTAPAAPSITQVGATGNYINANNQTAVNVTGTADAGSIVVVNLTDGSATTTATTTATGGTFSTSLDASGLADGSVTATAKAIDQAGNIGPAATATATKDTAAPTVSSITTLDTNHNGTIDTADIVFSEPMRLSSLVAGDFTIGGTAATVVTASSTNPDAYLFQVSPGVASTTAKTVAYTGTTATDVAGNQLVAFSQTSTDGAGPVLLSAKTTSTTTIDAMFSEKIKSRTVNTSGSEFTVAGYTVSGAHETSDGVVTLTLSAPMPTGATPNVTFTQNGLFTDEAGNEAVSPVTVTATDGVPPILSAVSIASNNASTTLAKAGDTVTLSFTASEDIQTPTVTIDGQNVTPSQGSGNEWTASRKMMASDAQGPVAFTIDYKDTAGNAGTQVTATTDGSGVFYDSIAPTVNAGSNEDVNAAVLHGAWFTDGAQSSGIAKVNWSEVAGPGTITFTPQNMATTTISASTDGTYTLGLTVTDNAGNTTTSDVNFVWDTTAPVVLTTNPTNGETGVGITSGTSTVTFSEPVTLTAGSKFLLVNDATSASHKVDVAVDSTNPAIIDIGHTAFSNGSKYRINVEPGAVTDLAGNAYANSLISYFTTQKDTTPPVVNSFTATNVGTSTADLAVTTNEPATCHYATTDLSYATMSGSFGTAATTTNSATLTGLTPNTSYTYYVRCEDASGNVMSTSANATFTTAVENSTAVLAVNGIDALSTYAAADGAFADGWKWVFHVTVPTDETYLRMKFDDFTSPGSTIPVAGNLRFYSAQSSNANATSTAITINGANAYSDAMHLTGDDSSTKAGRQVNITVEMRVPTGSAGGSYSTSYGIDTSTTTPTTH